MYQPNNWRSIIIVVRNGCEILISTRRFLLTFILRLVKKRNIHMYDYNLVCLGLSTIHTRQVLSLNNTKPFIKITLFSTSIIFVWEILLIVIFMGSYKDRQRTHVPYGKKSTYMGAYDMHAYKSRQVHRHLISMSTTQVLYIVRNTHSQF